MLLWSATSVHKQPCFSLRGPTFRLRGYVTQILFFLPISDSFMTVLTAWFWFFFSILPICGPRSDIQFFGNATFVYRPGRMYQTCRVSKFLYALFGDWQLSMNLQLFSNNMDFISSLPMRLYFNPQHKMEICGDLYYSSKAAMQTIYLLYAAMTWHHLSWSSLWNEES